MQTSNVAQLKTKVMGLKRPSNPQELIRLALKASSEVAPLWTLERFVSVNPFHASIHKPLPLVAADMERLLGARLYSSPDFYLGQYQSGFITRSDLESALEGRNTPGLQAPRQAEALERFLKEAPAHTRKKATALDSFIQTHIGKWMASLSENNGALWSVSAPPAEFYSRWRQLAQADNTFDIAGYGPLRKQFKLTPKDPLKALEALFNELSDSFEGELEPGLNLLRTLAHKNYGWMSYARFQDRERGMESELDSMANQLLGIQAACLLASIQSGLVTHSECLPRLGSEDTLMSESIWSLDIWQEAFERAARRKVTQHLQKQEVRLSTERKSIQAVFCIDARSEIYRRQLESLSSNVETVGFAGFFGMPMAFGADPSETNARCPVLLKPSFELKLGHPGAPHRAMTPSLVKKLPSTSFSFVEAFGAFYLKKLIKGLFSPKAPSDERNTAQASLITAGSKDAAHSALPLNTRVSLAQGFLQNTSLKGRLGRLILLCGHGSTSANNAYASALDCGACGGHRGDVNAIAACEVLNAADVRQALIGTPFEVPQDTLFIPGLHNTTTGRVTVFGLANLPPSHLSEARDLQQYLDQATLLSNKERSDLEDRDVRTQTPEAEAYTRAAHIGEVRPEWGLARNGFFVAGRRGLTTQLNLEGRSFLHDYCAEKDPEGSTLELILIAPLVVAHWINMQYYASTVDPEVFGSGNKTLHSVLGRFGVLEGTQHEIRVGLPLQSVHNGRDFVHAPQRLQVYIEAHPEAIDRVLKKHGHIAQLIKHKWITLISIQNEGRMLQRCSDAGVWQMEN